MPKKPQKPCKYQSCPHLTDTDYCEEHKNQARKRYERYERDPETSRRYGKPWRKIRERYVAQHPLCEQCFDEGCLRPVEHVHHIQELSQGGSNDFNNLMSLCKHHHSKEHLTRRNKGEGR
ncbi:HNH endonuclease [Pseudolactococcus yaeyamensis]